MDNCIIAFNKWRGTKRRGRLHLLNLFLNNLSDIFFILTFLKIFLTRDELQNYLTANTIDPSLLVYAIDAKSYELAKWILDNGGNIERPLQVFSKLSFKLFWGLNVFGFSIEFTTGESLIQYTG